MGLLDILQQYANPSAAPTDNVHQHFDQVAQQASPQDLGNGVAADLDQKSLDGIGVELRRR